jgi:glycosyltransferase involved in cell wall biosynthesis
MVNSCAIITSNTSGCPETVGEAGICIVPKEPTLLRDTILRLTSDQELSDRLGQLAYIRANSKFSWESIADGYEKLLKNCVRK